jgi:hypothetical protein
MDSDVPSSRSCFQNRPRGRLGWLISKAYLILIEQLAGLYFRGDDTQIRYLIQDLCRQNSHKSIIDVKSCMLRFSHCFALRRDLVHLPCQATNQLLSIRRRFHESLQIICSTWFVIRRNIKRYTHECGSYQFLPDPCNVIVSPARAHICRTPNPGQAQVIC